MKEGFIRKKELALQMFPDSTTPKVASDRLTRWINKSPELKKRLEELAPFPGCWYYNQSQVDEIRRHFCGIGIDDEG